MASASASVASTDETFIPEDLLERLLDSFSEDSDFDDNLVVEGDNGGTATATGDRPATELTDEEFDLSAQVEVADVFDGFSDDDSDDGDNVGPTENDEMRTILLMLDDEQLLTFDFTKSNTVSAVPAFVPTAQPGPTRVSPPGNGDAIDYFGMFYDDVFLSSVVDMTNNYAILRAAADQATRKHAYGSWKPLTIAELKAYYAIRLLIEITTKDRLVSYWQVCTITLHL